MAVKSGPSLSFLGIAGSLRRGSYNHGLIRAAVDQGRLESDTVRSDDNGAARFRWTLGDRPGPQHFVARADRLDTTYAVGAEKDHIVPWDSAWQITQLFGGDVRIFRTWRRYGASQRSPTSS